MIITRVYFPGAAGNTAGSQGCSWPKMVVLGDTGFTGALIKSVSSLLEQFDVFGTSQWTQHCIYKGQGRRSLKTPLGLVWHSRMLDRSTPAFLSSSLITLLMLGLSVSPDTTGVRVTGGWGGGRNIFWGFTPLPVLWRFWGISLNIDSHKDSGAELHHRITSHLLQLSAGNGDHKWPLILIMTSRSRFRMLSSGS